LSSCWEFYGRKSSVGLILSGEKVDKNSIDVLILVGARLHLI
jgi:hypothetical protein